MTDPTVHMDYQRIQENAYQQKLQDEQDEYLDERNERRRALAKKHHEGWGRRAWRFFLGAVFWIVVICLFQGN